MWPHTVGILIGGQSKRMGSPKHLVELPNGKTMLEMMLQFAASVGKQTVILGGEVGGQQCIPDLRIQQGHVAGIEALLHSNIDTNYLVVGCDMPLLQPSDIAKLLSHNNNAAFSYKNKTVGLPVCLHSDALSTCTAYLDSGGRSIRGFISELPCSTVEITSSQKLILTSLNSQDEINRKFDIQ